MDHRTIVELDYGLSRAEKAGNAGVSATTTVRVQEPLVAHPDGGGGLLGRIQGWCGFDPVHGWLELPGVDPAAWVAGRGRPGLGPASTDWIVQTTAGNVVLANTRITLVAAYTNAAGHFVIEPAVQLDGAALAAVGAPASMRLVVELRRLFAANTSGQLLVGDFVNPDDFDPTPADLQPYVTAALQRARFNSNQVLLNTDPVRLANNCNASFSDPWSRVWLGPGDIGLGSAQLPPDLAQQSAEQLRKFPSIFLRRTPYIRGFRAATGASDNAVNTPESAPRVLVTARAPTFSRWRLWVDGRMADVWVAHPAGSDLRTPLAVWNAVFASTAIGAAVTVPFPVFRASTGPGRTTYHVQGVIGRNTYLEAAEFAAFGDEEEDPEGITVEMPLG